MHTAKMQNIFEFLKKNCEFNRQTQHAYYKQTLSAWPDNGDKLRALLYATAGTQSRASLNSLEKTWKRLHEHKKEFDEVRTTAQLAIVFRWLEKPSKKTSAQPVHVFDEMRISLERAEGFGEKTATLFVKSIIDIHTLDINKGLRFLEQFNIDAKDTINIPVDSVIKFIFDYDNNTNFTPGDINKMISASGIRSEGHLTTWDDLWFWGFITQLGGGENRKLGLNTAKFWALQGSPKDQSSEIFQAATEFINILSTSAVFNPAAKRTPTTL